MEHSTAVRNFLLAAMEHLPPGFRFCPTDEEAVVNYLPGLGCIRGVTVVPQIDICQWEPVELPVQFQNLSIVPSSDLEGWFLCKQEPGQKVKRSAKGGFWKITGQPVDVRERYTNDLIATKKFLTFYKKGQGIKETKTNWVMHEYYLANGNVRDFVLCHVMLKSDTVLDLMDEIADGSFPEDSIQETVESLLDKDLAQATMESLLTADQAASAGSHWQISSSDAESFIEHSFIEDIDSSAMEFSLTSDSVDQYEYYSGEERVVIRENKQTQSIKSIHGVLPFDEMEGLVEDASAVTKRRSYGSTNATQEEGYGENYLHTPNPKLPVAKKSAKMETTSPGSAASISKAKEVRKHVAAVNMIEKKDMAMANLKGGKRSGQETMLTSKTESASSCSTCYDKECSCAPPIVYAVNLFIGVFLFVFILSNV